MINFEEVINNMIICSINLVNSEINGFVTTNDSICLLNSITIINNYKDIIYNKLSSEQIENIYSLYKNTINNNLFNQQSRIDFTNYIRLNN